MRSWTVSLAMLAVYAARPIVGDVTPHPNCLTDPNQAVGTASLYWGKYMDQPSNVTLLVFEPGLIQGAVLTLNDTPSDSLGCAYAQADCAETDVAQVGFSGLAQDETYNYSPISKLCLTASGVGRSDLSITLQPCEYAKGRTDSPIATQNFALAADTGGLVYFGEETCALGPDAKKRIVHYQPRIDSHGVLRYDYSKKGYPFPEIYNTKMNLTYAIAWSYAD